MVAPDWRRRRDGGEPRPTALPVTGPALAGLAVSPDGRRVAWTAAASSSSIWAAPPAPHAGVLPTPLVPSTEIGWRAAHPAVAADGRIAFMGNRGNAGNKIFLVEPTRPPRQLTTDARDHFSPFWLRGDNALAVLANHGDVVGWWRLDPATGRERLLFPLDQITRPPDVQAQVVGPAAGMAISADFRRLAIAYVRDGVPNLWTGTLGPHGPNGPLVQRTFETISGAFGAWSPDGSWLAYQCGRGGDTQLCVVDAEGRAPARQLTTAPGTNFIGEWTDDDAILFAARERAVVEHPARGARDRHRHSDDRVRRAAVLRALRAMGRGQPARRLRARRDDRAALVGADPGPHCGSTTRARRLALKNTLANRCSGSRPSGSSGEFDDTTAASCPSSVVAPTRRPSTVAVRTARSPASDPSTDVPGRQAVIRPAPRRFPEQHERVGARIGHEAAQRRRRA